MTITASGSSTSHHEQDAGSHSAFEDVNRFVRGAANQLEVADDIVAAIVACEREVVV